MLRGIRVYELARELDMSSKDILRLLADEMNIEMNNHMATLNDQVVAKLRRLAADQKGGQTPQVAAPGTKTVREPAAGPARPAALPKIGRAHV